MKRAILLRYHEIALKGRNRSWFEERLVTNLRRMIQPGQESGKSIEITRHHGRIIVHSEWSDSVNEALSRTFGLSSYSPMRVVPTERKTLLESAIEEFESHVNAFGLPGTFRVFTRRSDKVFPEPSNEIDRWIGGEIKGRYPSLKVSLQNPELTLGLELRKEISFIWTRKIPGTGGLPVGTNARTLCLLSGGLDSPVAAIQVLRRGSPVSFVHFFGAPFVGEEALEKVEDLVRIVNRYQPEPGLLHIVPFGKIQEQIALSAEAKMRTLLYRRLMVRIACALAKQLRIGAIVTGESLGQVASQTVENLATIDSVSSLPILRPLIAYDKQEIIQAARRWGTYETSIRAATDCCTLFADRHPAIRATPSIAERQEIKLPIDEFVNEALATTYSQRQKQS